MYKATIRSEHTTRPEVKAEEFSIERPTLDQAIAAMMLSELDVACESWITDLQIEISRSYKESGFSFTILDQGSDLLYTYSFTAV